VAHVPLMAAGELGDPLTLLVLVEADDRALHPTSVRRAQRRRPLVRTRRRCEAPASMTRVDLSGWLLVASFVLWFPAAALPARIWTAPHPERLTLIGERRRRWQVVNLSIAGAAVLLVLGFVALAEPLRREGAATLSDLSLALLLLGAPLWLASLVHRMVVAGDGAAWAGGLFLAWSVIANVAIIGLGAALVRSGHAGTWSGWTAVVLGALVLVQLLVTGDALPASYHVGPAAMGVAVLLS
jgi:hypothetical protein